MIKKIIHTEYVVVCNEIKDAKEAGWKFTPRCFEQDIAVCPKCQGK